MWIAIYELKARTGASYHLILRWIARSQGRKNFYPPELKAIQGKHFQILHKKGYKGRDKFLFNPQVCTEKFMKRVRNYGALRPLSTNFAICAKPKTSEVRRKGIELEPELKGIFFYCMKRGEVKNEACRACYMRYSDEVKESMNWQQCRDRNEIHKE